MSKVIRTVKNVTKGYSSTQVKVRNATSNDPWGPTGTEMSDIARMTFDTAHDFFEIMDMLDKRLNDKGKNWRHVLKALKVLDYCLHEGSEHVVVWAKDNMYIIKTLREFQYIDEEGRDQGLNVRISAKELTSLILDEERLRNERKDRKSWKSRVTGIEDYASSSNGPPHRPDAVDRRRPRRASQGRGGREDEDLEYKLAIEASKNQAEEDRRRIASRSGNENDSDLEKAIKLSKEEEEFRQRELEQSNADSLFDDAATPVQTPQIQQPQYQQQDYVQGGHVDLFGNPLGQQSTGYLSNVYSNPTGYPQQPQQTGFEQTQQQQFFPQQPVFDQNQQQQQQPIYTGAVMPQMTGYNNPYSAPALSPQQTAFLQPGDKNPYVNNGLQAPSQPLQPLPTGSNNPFAPKMSGFGTQSPPRSGPPSLSALQQQHQQQPFQQTQSFQQPQFTSAQQTPSATPQPQQKPQNPEHARLESLLQAGGDGLDTFGNVGNLRIPAQHTAPGTFINSAGQGRRPLAAQSTGNNPFFNQQSTGIPQTSGFGASLSPQPQQRLMPALTGPAGMNGFNGFPQQQQQPQMPQNPYGGQQQQQQYNGFAQPQQQQQGGGNLIDL